MRAFISSALAFSFATFGFGCSSSDEKGSPPPPGSPPTTVTPEATQPANLEKTACRFMVPTSLEGKAYDCYDLLAPENRSVAGSHTIKVHFIVFKGKAGGTSTIELNGGPGGPSEDIAVGLAVGDPELKDSMGKLLDAGDYILVDQRGTGRSIPRVSCTDAEMSGGVTEGSKKCADRNTAAGIDLTGYVTSENADDIHDIKVALGLPKVNLHSISYGTRLALEVMRRHPDDVAAAIIDGVMPAQAKALSEGDLNYDVLLTKIFAACAADAKCNAAYPNLDKTLDDVHAKLTATPFKFMGEPYDWYAFVGDLFENMGGDAYAGKVPRKIHMLATETQDEFAADAQAEMDAMDKAYQEMDAQLASTDLGREALARQKSDPDPGAAGMADGMYLSVVCSDYAQYESVDEALALENRIRPDFQSDEHVRDVFDGCTPWPKRAKAVDVFAPVSAGVPTLAIAGDYDPITPVAWRDLAAATLGQSQKVNMGAGAHGSVDACAMGIKVAFLGAPSAAVDGSCAAAQKIEFVYDAAPQKFHRSISHDVARPIAAGARSRMMSMAPAVIARRWGAGRH